MMHGAERKTRVPPQAINCTTAQPPTSSSAHLPRLAWSPRELDPSTGTHPPPLSAAARPARRRLHAPKRTPATMRPRGQQKRNQEQLYRGWSVAEGACSFFDRCLLRQPTRGAMHRVCPLDTLLVSSKVNERQGRVRCPEGVHIFRGSSLPGEQKRTGRNENTGSAWMYYLSTYRNIMTLARSFHTSTATAATARTFRSAPRRSARSALLRSASRVTHPPQTRSPALALHTPHFHRRPAAAIARFQGPIWLGVALYKQDGRFYSRGGLTAWLVVCRADKVLCGEGGGGG